MFLAGRAFTKVMGQAFDKTADSRPMREMASLANSFGVNLGGHAPRTQRQDRAAVVWIQGRGRRRSCYTPNGGAKQHAAGDGKEAVANAPATINTHRLSTNGRYCLRASLAQILETLDGRVLLVEFAAMTGAMDGRAQSTSGRTIGLSVSRRGYRERNARGRLHAIASWGR
jgi:hypothetical protein